MAPQGNQVGDIHQPLHAGFAEDRGGNSVDVRFNGRKTNLHSLWDTGLVELEEGTPAEVAARIEETLTDDDRKQWQGGRPEQWALESLAIVRAQVYRFQNSDEIKSGYRDVDTLQLTVNVHIATMNASREQIGLDYRDQFIT